MERGREQREQRGSRSGQPERDQGWCWARHSLLFSCLRGELTGSRAKKQRATTHDGVDSPQRRGSPALLGRTEETRQFQRRPETLQRSGGGVDLEILRSALGLEAPAAAELELGV